jgi:chromosome segregation ATPase
MSETVERDVLETPAKETTEATQEVPKTVLQEEKTADHELEEDEMMGAEAIYSVSLAMRKAQSNVASIENEIRLCEDTIAELEGSISAREGDLDVAKNQEKEIDRKLDDAGERNKELAKSLESEQAAYARLKTVSSKGRFTLRMFPRILSHQLRHFLL